VHAAKTLADHLAMVGKPVCDKELILYLIRGLTPRYNAFITSFTLMTKDESVSLEDFQTLLFSHEQLLKNQMAETEATSFALHGQTTTLASQGLVILTGKTKLGSPIPNKIRLGSHLVLTSEENFL
jgi:hypothetical protein